MLIVASTVIVLVEEPGTTSLNASTPPSGASVIAPVNVTVTFEAQRLALPCAPTAAVFLSTRIGYAKVPSSYRYSLPYVVVPFDARCTGSGDVPSAVMLHASMYPLDITVPPE